MVDIPGLEALRLAIFPVVGGTDAGGPLAMAVGGTVNIIGGGSGGTSMIDNSAFTPSSTSFTPVGGYRGGRSVASGNAGVFAIDGSGNMQVNVVAGGAGGGVANITVRGSANSDLHVGYASGAGFNTDGGAYLPILGSVNVGGVVGSVNAVLGTLPVPMVGSVNVLGTIGAQQLGAPWSMIGSVNVTAVSTQTVTFGGAATVWYGGIGADTANSAIRVNVVAGAAGGGVANLEVQGTANTAIHVGYASGAGLFADGGAAIPVLGTVNVIGGGFATVGVYGSVSVTGSVNAVMGTLPLPITGTVWLGGLGADTTNSALRVNVVAGGAGGGVANLTVRGTGNTDYHIGYASNNLGAWPNYDGGAWLPVMFPSGYYPTINSAGGAGGGGFATVAVYGSPAFPVYNVGSVNVVNNVGVTQVTSPWVVTGSVNITGSINPVGIFGSVSVVGSVNAVMGTLPLPITGTVTGIPSGIQIVDVRGSISPTQWAIQVGASGPNVLFNAPGAGAIKLYGLTMIANATVNYRIQSPSGTDLTGSMTLLPGAGVVEIAPIRDPLYTGAATATWNLWLSNAAAVGGIARGWIE